MFRIEIVLQLQYGPNFAADTEGVVSGLNREIKPRHMVKPVPKTVLEIEVERLPLLRLPGHAMDTPLFESMKSHDVSGPILSNSRRKISQHAVRETRGGMYVHHGETAHIAMNEARQLDRKLHILKSPRKVGSFF